MTREQLDSYKSKKAEIKELQYKLEHLGEGDSMIGNDTIFDYRTGYPQPQSVVGVDWEKMDRLSARYEKQKDELTAECEEVEMWIEDIPDSLTRRIFRMYFVDGIKFAQIGKAVNTDKSTVSRKISNYLKVATHTTNATL